MGSIYNMDTVDKEMIHVQSRNFIPFLRMTHKLNNLIYFYKFTFNISRISITETVEREMEDKQKLLCVLIQYQTRKLTLITEGDYRPRK
jgi:hypothetical protein